MDNRQPERRGVSRRAVLKGAAATGGAAVVTQLLGGRAANAAAATAAASTRDTRAEWLQLDPLIDQFFNTVNGIADENAIRADTSKTLLFMPFENHGFSTVLPGWDTYFANVGLLTYGLSDFVRNHVLNQLFLSERLGYVPNGNQTSVDTRSQPPLWSEGTRRYLEVANDREVAMLAYTLLVQEYNDFWTAGHHSTPIGLATDRDLGDPSLSAPLAAEAETGLDFTPIFGGDVRRCAPIQTNVLLANYEDVLAWLAPQVGRAGEAAGWRARHDQRAARIQRYCWDAKTGFFLEYDYVAKQRLPYLSLCAYWPMWAGIATKAQAAQLVAHLSDFETDYGLVQTDRLYPDPHDPVNDFWCQWQWPAGWPPMQMMVVTALQRYGYTTEAKRIAKKWVDLLTDLYFNRGATADVAANESTSDSAPTLTAGHTFGQSFTAAQPIIRAGGHFATDGTSGAGMTLNLRSGGPTGDVVASKRVDPVFDNSWVYLELDQPLPAGDYFLEQADPTGTIAWSSSSTDAYADGSSYVDGSPVAGDRVFVAQESTGGTAQLWEKYNVVDGNLDLPPSHYSQVPLLDQPWAHASAATLGRVAYGT